MKLKTAEWNQTDNNGKDLYWSNDKTAESHWMHYNIKEHNWMMFKSSESNWTDKNSKEVHWELNETEGRSMGRNFTEIVTKELSRQECEGTWLNQWQKS